MGSLRNPIGPLPSSIYWRRRAVALAIVVLLALLVVWAVNWGGGAGKSSDEGKGAHGSGPATSITPGPSGSGPANDQKPGGRDESGDDGGSGSGSGGSGTAGGGSGSSGGSGGSGGSGSGSGSGPIGQGSGKNAVAAGSSLPNCVSGKAELDLRSVKHSYAPGTRPKFELTIENAAGAACKVDLGQKAAVLTISDAAGDERVWASNDCPSGTAPALLQVPAKGSVQRTIVWDRRASGPQCATPSSAKVPAGKYEIEAKVPGLEAARTTFVLAEG
ncbi:hypothetical protein Sgleb_39860 [Streptomyces glebosus]|uniref:DUF4232 domain-containing protein n=1 Tax=Streptomyces glebosus TaxID=249580 RepID=A0A640SX20_9ACTN|nr:hypothetical protein [Streptomyces glebosus]GFE15939.1 hypothetical protein Sgleb_39860 [Streptomyces glebosus]GHG85783.1 hypothetical protein GCM10010513_66690 [Streptomyces glebosus]